MKALLLLVSFFLFTQLTQAQTAGVAGTVRDAQQRPLPFASVSVPAQAQGTTADDKGQFQLSGLKSGPVRLLVSAVGYTAVERQLTLVNDQVQQLELSLAPAAALQEVVVTGVSRATELRRSPVPVAALSQREIRLQSGSTIVESAVKGIPGLSAVTTGPNVAKPFIRGLGYNRVLTLYNGLRQEGQQWGDEHGLEVDGYDVDRIEVVKGPASLSYGSDAVAGVLNLLPRLPGCPEGELGGEMLSEFQTNNRLLGNSVALNYQRNGLQTAGRASYRRAQSYHNSVDGRVYGTAFHDLNLTAMLGLSKSWGSVHYTATLYDNQQEIPDGSRDSLSRRFTRQVAEGLADDLSQRPLVSDDDLATYRLQPLHQRIRHYRLLGRHRLRLGAGELNLLLGAQHNLRQEYSHPTAPALPGLELALTTYNYDLRYAAPAWHGLELTTGLNGMGQLNANGPATDFPIPDYRLFDLGGYAHLKQALGKLELSGGLRYDVRRLRWDDLYVAPDPATGFGRRSDASGERQFAAFAKWYDGVSASLGATYELSPRLMLRLNLARGYRAPNITEVGSNGLDPGAHIVYLGNREFRPEFSWQQDVGATLTLPDADLNASVFYNQMENYIFQARLYDENGQPVVLVPGNATYQYQQSRARLYGGELSLNLHPRALPGLSLNTGLAYVTGLHQDEELLRLNGAAARYLPLIPPARLRSELRYTHPRAWGPFNQPYLRATVDADATQNRFYAVDNTETATPGYTLLGLGAGASLTAGPQRRECLQLFVQLDNLFDVAYQSHLNRLKYFEYYQATPNGRRGIYNQGRNLSVKVVVPF